MNALSIITLAKWGLPGKLGHIIPSQQPLILCHEQHQGLCSRNKALPIITASLSEYGEDETSANNHQCLRRSLESLKKVRFITDLALD